MDVSCTACIDWQENGDGSQFVCEICDLYECSTNMGPQENFPTTNDEDSATTMVVMAKKINQCHGGMLKRKFG